jgi:hypothetical protein
LGEKVTLATLFRCPNYHVYQRDQEARAAAFRGQRAAAGPGNMGGAAGPEEGIVARIPGPPGKIVTSFTLTL